MKFFTRHINGFLAAGIALVVFLILLLNGKNLGLTRDEGYYFDASERYAGWFEQLGRDAGAAFSEPVIRRYYEVNREHPVLIKNLMALSFMALAPERSHSTSWPPSQQGGFVLSMRLPAYVLSALTVALVFLLGCSLSSRRVGIFAGLAFFLAPRHFYHAGLACFDMPVTFFWLATVMAYRKSRTSFGWAIATGALWGLSISVKHNAFFLPIVLGLHWLICEGRNFSLSRKGIRLPRVPVAFICMIILGPAIFFLHWPLLWNDTFERLGWYFGFHLHHINYYWEYFGTLLTDPPFPWLYPFAVTALTLPAPTLVLSLLGFFAILGNRLGRPVRSLAHVLGRLAGFRAGPDRPATNGDSPGRQDGWLLLLNAFIPLMIISVPSVPIFGGMKHWLHAMPFLCLLAGISLERALATLPSRIGRLRLTPSRAFGVIAPLALLPSLLGLLHMGNFGSSYYNEVAGGVSGAASLGMQRQYWSNNVTGILPWINESAPRSARLYLHEVNGECYRTYRRDGYLRPDLRMAWSPDHSDLTAYQYHREFVDTEYRVWNLLGHKKISHGLYIDEVPIILVYDLERSLSPSPRSRTRTSLPP